jgi:hypothetical protein
MKILKVFLSTCFWKLTCGFVMSLAAINPGLAALITNFKVGDNFFNPPPFAFRSTMECAGPGAESPTIPQPESLRVRINNDYSP